MIAWCGSRSDGLGWLSDRCGSADEIEFSETLSIEAINAICSKHPRRLVLSVENRLSYPWAEIRHVQRAWPEIPFALAVGTWFDGSRRTGIGSMSHLTLPWYRWWDGWQAWVNGLQAELLNPWPQMMRGRSRVVVEMGQPKKSSGVILSNCRKTADGWREGLECDQNSTNFATLSKFRSSWDQAAMIAPNWVLWDDSCLDTFTGGDRLSEVCELFTAIRVRFPATVILVATCMPRWSDWRQWTAAGANELIAKPSHGIVLHEVVRGMSAGTESHGF
jgi:hypothetical protein